MLGWISFRKLVAKVLHNSARKMFLMTREVLNKGIKTLSSLVLATDVKRETLYRAEVETQAADGKDLILIGLAIGQA